MRRGRVWKGCLTAAMVTAAVMPAGPATAGPDPGGRGGRAAPAPSQTVTLVTGDRVTVSGPGGDRIMFTPGKGREGISYTRDDFDGHVTLTPADAAPMVSSGKLDRRLFDVTTLLEYGYDDRHGGLPLIVATTARGLRAVSMTGARVVRDLPAVGGSAIRREPRDAAAFWDNLTAAGRPGIRAMRADIDRVWLDGKLAPALDVSVPQIGAPAAWQAGYTGKGVTVGVVDTGIDATHPDLAGKVGDRATFVEDDAAGDDAGHGTHVASTIAGSGAASSGRYRGVAPDATLVDAKVCDQDGDCPQSAVVAGMQWAVAEKHAAVVNVSLSGPDGIDVDPMEAAVHNLSQQYNVLFVVAAGNQGPNAMSIGTPAGVDEALTVGAVDRDEQIAPFSSRGPRSRDHALKPEITAPGVGIVAARSKDGRMGEPTGPDNRYVRASGTSMATPHVVGAAAILSQEHPDWTGPQLKAALIASARPNPALGPTEQGAGRVDVARAVTQQVTVSPPTVSFGEQHDPPGGVPVSRTLTYHNSGAAAVTLDLSLPAKGADGKPAPAALFTMDANRLTVPAGGDARVAVAVDTRAGSPDGLASAVVTATSGDLVVRTPVLVDKQYDSVDLTIRHSYITGLTRSTLTDSVIDLDTGARWLVNDTPGDLRLRLPKSRYAVVVRMTGGYQKPVVQMMYPELKLTAAQTVVADANQAKPIEITVPRAGASTLRTVVGATFQIANRPFPAGSWLADNVIEDMRIGRLGPATPAPGVVMALTSEWGRRIPGTMSFRNSPYVYALSWYQRGQVYDGFTRTVRDRDLANVRVDMGSAADRVLGLRAPLPLVPGASGYAAETYAVDYDLPGVANEYYNTDGGIRWASTFEHYSLDENWWVDNVTSPPSAYRPGRTYHETWNRAVFGPALPADSLQYDNATRTGDELLFDVPLFGDGAGRPGARPDNDTTLTVYRNGTKFSEEQATGTRLDVPPQAGRYRVVAESTSAAPFQLSTKVTSAWTFRSGHVGGQRPKPVPLLAVRFAPPVDRTNTAPANRLVAVPVTVDRWGGAGRPTELSVRVSFDDGKTWQPSWVIAGRALVRHPEGHGFVSIRAAASDRDGNRVEETIIRAYRY